MAVKRILCYVAGTRGWGVRYSAGKEKTKLELVGYSDSDMAGDIDDRKSTSGMIYFLSADAICWQSTKQKVVDLSSCEAEYIAASMAATQGVWLARLMEELIGRENDPPMLYVDNKATISLIKNPILHDWSKHIEITTTSENVQIEGSSRLISFEQRNNLETFSPSPWCG